MKRIRLIGSCVAIGGAALLSGCVAVPGPGYYGSPYYVDQGPTIVPGASVYIDGGSYYGRQPYYYGGPAYYGHRHGYYGGRPGPRPGWNGHPRGDLRPPVVGALPGVAPGGHWRQQRSDQP